MKLIRIVGLVLVAFLMTAGFASAQTGATSQTYVLSGAGIGAGIGAALTIMGAGYGFGRIGSAALESMARQPEVRGNIQTAMIVIAALLEGATFFALLVCIQLVAKTTF